MTRPSPYSAVLRRHYPGLSPTLNESPHRKRGFFKERDFFKIVRSDGYDFKGAARYAPGLTVYIPENERDGRPVVCTSSVVHASVKLTDAMRHIPSPGERRSFQADQYQRVFKVHGTPVCRDEAGAKHGFFEYDVISEYTHPLELVGILLKENVRRYDPSMRRTYSMGRPEAVHLVRKRFLCGGVA